MPIVIVSSVTPMSVAIDAGSTAGASSLRPRPASFGARWASVPARLGGVRAAVTPEAPANASAEARRDCGDSHFFFMLSPMLVVGWLLSGCGSPVSEMIST